jgi:eukaryotic-like serine/threonine-protein kinase
VHASIIAEALTGRYTIERELGRGGMATVYLAHDLKHGRPVALKVLHPELASTLGPERFLREIRTTAQLQHPHILTVLDSGEAAGLLWYTMPYVEGESLRDRLRCDVQLPVEEAVRLAREIALALDHAHRHGVVHRDIKPENILLCDGQALVADFGVARAVDAGSEGKLTETGMAVGTPAYMSPEQASGSSELDGRTDLYALGCVLYEMLAGEPPYTGPTPQAIVAKRFTGPIPSIRTLRETVPESVEHAVTKVLARVPADRFATAAEFSEALAQVSSLPAGADSQPTGFGGRRIARRALPRWTLAAAVGTVVLALAAAAYLFHARREGTSKPPDNLITLAVLPFHLLARSEDTGALGIGIPDAIITRLANVRQLRVRPTSAIMRYQDQTPEVRAVGRALATEYILDGTVQPAGVRLRVSVQLLRARDAALIWGERYDLARQDLLTLQDSIAGRVSSALAVRMSSEERARVYRRYTENADAYELYLAGRSQLARLTKEGTLAAIDAFERALRLDSAYGLARAGLAMASADMHLRFASGPEVKRWGARAEAEARRAMALDSNLAEAHLAMAAVYRKAEFNWEGTLEESRRALALNPGLDLPHYYRAAAFYHLSLFGLAEREVREGQAASPENRVEQLRTQGVIALLSGRATEAVPQLEEVRRLSDRPLSDSYLAQAYFYAGDHARAEAMLDTLSRSSSASAAARSQATLASFLAARGERTRAEALLRDVTAGAYMDHHVAYSIGAAYAQLGQHTEARKWLAQAAHTGLPCYEWFEWDPLLQSLRTDPAFQQFMGEMRNARDAAQHRYGS